VFPKLLLCLRALPSLGLPNLLMRGCDLRRLFKAEFRIEFHCCSKTFGQAFAAFAANTPLLNMVGKRLGLLLGDLLRADSELMREIARLTPKKKQEAPPTPSASLTAGTPRSPEPPTAAQPVATPATSASSTAGTPPSSAPPAPEPQPVVQSPASRATEPDLASPPVVDPAPEASPPEGDAAALADLPWLVARGYRRYQPLPRNGRLRVTLASVPQSESASRWTRKKSDDP
jgi:hypothetical protein